MRWSFALLLALLLGLVASGSVGAQVRLTRGPYLQDASASGITLMWQTDRATAPTVEYRLDDDRADTPWLAVGSGERARVHAITLTGLEPHTQYQYRVRADGALLYEGGLLRTLRVPGADTLDFVVYGDNRTNHQAHRDVVRRILREEPLPDLLIHTGDLVENGIHPEEWDIYFRIEGDLLARVPLYPALGNHEDDSSIYFQSFRTPSNGTLTGRGRWYSFDSGPAHFVALDVVFSDISPGSPQYRWLEADLARTDQPWKFVYFHYPLYNASAPHGSNWRLREILEPLFLAHGVSAVFTGHAHIYERAFGGGQPPLLYMVSGGGGAPQHRIGREPWTRYAEASFHFVRVTLREDHMTTVGVRADGSEFDRFEGRLNAAGRLEETGTVLVAPVVVPGPTLARFLGSFQGALFLGYTLLFTLAVPLVFMGLLRTRRAAVLPVPSGALVLRRPKVEDPHLEGWRGLRVIPLMGGITALLLLAMVIDAPLHWLIGFDLYSITLTAHAALATALTTAAVLAASMSYRLAHGRAPTPPWLAINAGAAAGLSLLSVLLGNALYAGYRVSAGPMERLILKAPEAHRVLFEFKEYVGLVPLPLAVTAAFIIWRYGPDLRRDRYLAEVVSLLLLLLTLYCLFPLGLGAAITRLRGIV